VIYLLLVDDHAVVREGWKRMLAEEPDFIVGGEAGTAERAMELVREQPWGVVVLDLSLPDKNGIELLREILQARPQQPVLVATMHAEATYAMRALRAGAKGYIQKDAHPHELLEALRKVGAGGRYISPAFAESLAESLQHPERELPHQRLSDREHEVLVKLALGLTTRSIAEELGISIKTVGAFRGRILEKLGLKSTAAAIRYAIEHNLVA